MGYLYPTIERYILKACRLSQALSERIMDVQKQGKESLLIITDSMRSCPESADIASRAIMCFDEGDDRNIEGLASIGVDGFSDVLIGQVDNNKECFEDTDYRKPIYNFSLDVPAKALERLQALSSLDVPGIGIILIIFL